MSIPTQYALTDSERLVLSALNSQALAAKAEAHDLAEKIDATKRRLDSIQATFTGVLTGIARAHGMDAATISADLSTLISAQ